MSSISKGELIEYFKSRKGRFSNSKGLELGLTARNEIWTYSSQTNDNPDILPIDISTDEETFSEFIHHFKLKTVNDIDDLGYPNLWARYLNGYAEITINHLEIEAALNFRIVKRKTIIYSLELHFYDEMYEHLTIAEDFQRYMSTHENRLNMAAENRYRMNRK